MVISAQELREILIPQLQGWKHKANDFKRIECDNCHKIHNDLLEWLDNLMTIENGQNDLHIIGDHKDWTK